MPRDIPIGNGSLLVAFDSGYRLRELYYPYVGQENHTMGRPSRVGVRADGVTSWIGDAGWSVDLRYEVDAPVTSVVALHRGLGLEIRATDAVDFLRPVLLRRFVVRDLRGAARSVRVLLHHDFDLLESDAAVTAFFDPRTKAVVHYKRRRYALVNVSCDGRAGTEEYTTGARKYFDGRGTAGQAEEHESLDRHPIAQGAVDSTIAVSLDLAPGGEARLHAWLAMGKRYQDVASLNELVAREGAEAWIDRTRTHGRAWVAAADVASVPPAPLRSEHLRAFRTSLHVTRTQIDAGGAILAANDTDVLAYARDSYSYCWPRDGALVAAALDDAGQPEIVRRFFEFCAAHVAAEGYFLHKYNPDGSLASSWHAWIKNGVEELPIQEDETALVMWALERHHAKYRDFDFLAPIYHRFVQKAANFMAAYRDPATKLPLPSWDLWEERRGVHAFTVAATYAGLRGASRLAETFGDAESSLRWAGAADEIRSAFETFFFHGELGRFVRTGYREGGGYWLDVKLDASLAGIFLFGLLPADDPRMVRTMEAVEEALTVAGPIGGVARYEDDWFHQVVKGDPRTPGNPWFVCTLWLAEWRAAVAKSIEDLLPAVAGLDWALARALPSGVMAEQLDPRTGAPLSVSPLTWSHAAYISAYSRIAARATALAAAPHAALT